MEWCTVPCNCLLDKQQAVRAHIFSLELLPNWVILWGRTESAVHFQKLSPGERETVKYFFSLQNLLVLDNQHTDAAQKGGIFMCPDHFSWALSAMQIVYSLIASFKFPFPQIYTMSRSLFCASVLSRELTRALWVTPMRFTQKSNRKDCFCNQCSVKVSPNSLNT